MQHTRLIAIDDIYLSSSYTSCQGKPNPAPAAAQIAWLRTQLAAARRLHQQVWLIGHLPPGVDLYNTVMGARDVCATHTPIAFLSSPALDDALLSGGGILRLALFAHTHMDEMRLLQSPGDPTRDIPIKLVPSISPVNGNAPSFLVARVSPATATLIDYTAFTASNRTGIDTSWTREYSYSAAYHLPAFDGPSLERLMAKFQADPQASTPESQIYIRSYFAGLGSTLTPLWPAYACVLTHLTPESYASCLCHNK
jgi:sphingomyelin phosphodiesterase acid-like 3